MREGVNEMKREARERDYNYLSKQPQYTLSIHPPFPSQDFVAMP